MNPIPAIWVHGKCGFGSHGLVKHALEGTLWPTPRPFQFRQVMGALLQDPKEGGVVISDWGLKVNDPLLKNYTDKFPWAVFLSTSDEVGGLDWRSIKRPEVKVWIQMPFAGKHDDVDRRFPIGWHPQTRDHLRKLLISSPPRDLAWSFVGQGGPAREECLKALATMTGGYLLVTGGFHQGLSMEEYLTLLLRTKIAPSPAGGHSNDTFRTWEALEAGCLPMPSRAGRQDDRGFDYYCAAVEDPPFARVSDWRTFEMMVTNYLEAPHLLLEHTNRSTAWWLNYKRRFVTDLEDDLMTLGQTPPETNTLRHLVTVVMTTSPIHLHPSTDMIEAVIRKIRSYPELAECEVIIGVDGLSAEQLHHRERYEEYKRQLIHNCNWKPELSGVLPVVFSEYSHQSGMMGTLLSKVRTPVILFCCHDEAPKGDIDFRGIVNALLKNPTVNVVRPHVYSELLPEPSHGRLYLDRSPHVIEGVPLIRTVCWSQRPHLAKTEFYKRMIEDNFGEDAKVNIEDLMWPILSNQCLYHGVPHEKWGVWIYAPSGDMCRSEHLDGRGPEKRTQITYAYDGKPPLGAPRAGTVEP